MMFSILAFEMISVYGDVEESTIWNNHTYNVSIIRFSGLNKDSSWHNRHSFMVNSKTLIEVSFLYSRITCFDFFTDQWQ